MNESENENEIESESEIVKKKRKTYIPEAILKRMYTTVGANRKSSEAVAKLDEYAHTITGLLLEKLDYQKKQCKRSKTANAEHIRFLIEDEGDFV